MNCVKKTIRVTTILVLACLMLASTVFATGEGSVWFNSVQNDDQTTVYVVTDDVVTDGLIELTFDSEAMAYQDIEVNKALVAMYAVNADEAGTVKIGWIAPSEVASDENQWLLKVTLSGVGEATMSGAINGGADTECAALDLSELEKQVLEAESLYEDNYTYRSWSTLKKALKMAKDVLADPTADQSEVDAAAETLAKGIASLELKIVANNTKLYKAILRASGLKKDLYTEESWNELQDALKNARAVNMNKRATQQQIDEATNALNEAIDNLELKPEEPEAPTEPGKPTVPEKPGVPGIIGKWVDMVRKIIGGWFGRGK